MGSRKVIYVIVIFLLVISIVYIPGVVGKEECQTCAYEGCEICVWDESDEYCIFHDPDPDKNRDLFLDELQKRMDIGNYDFSGFVFPRNITTVFSSPHHSYHFDKKVYFKNAVFWSYTSFTDITFEEGADFSGAIFKAGTDFANVTFNGITEFNDVTFEDEVLFLIVTFKKDVSFKKGSQKKGTIFEGETSFSGVKFEESVYFDDAVFEDIVWFQSHGTNENTTFGKENYPDDRQCQPIASFIGTEFNGQTSFSESIFNIKADFQSAEFKGDTYFTGTEFGYNANFRHTKFYNEANFNIAKFKSNINFIFTSFKGDSYFTGTTFKSFVDFSKSKFEQKFDFNPNENHMVILTDAQVYGYGQITADLKETKFNNANLENVNFVNCIWPDNFIIYEEKKEKEKQKPNYKKLEILYKNLKNSFRKYGQSDLTGKAFYREMEMKRFGAKEEDNLGDYLFLLYFKLFAGYGEKPFNIIFCSVGFIFAFAVLFWILGIEISTIPYRLEFERYSRFTWRVDNRNRVRRLCKHRILNPICSFFSKIGLKRFFSLLWSFCSQIAIRDFAFCFLFSFSSFITLGNKYTKPKSNASHWLSVIESFIGTILIAAFVYLLLEKMFRYIK